MLALRPDPIRGFCQTVGIGGIGSGIVFALEGQETLSRNESRLGKLQDARDYCKLHIVAHYIAQLMGAKKAPHSFRVVPIGVIGSDAIGQRLFEEMDEAGLETQFVRTDSQAKTLFSVCFVYPDGSGGNITTSNSACSTLGEIDLRAARDAMKEAGPHGIALCLPEVPLESRRDFLRMAKECGNCRAASFVRSEIRLAREMNLYASIDLLALNKEEASALVGYPYEAAHTDRFLSDCSASLTALQPDIRIVLTVGENGAHGYEHGTWEFCPAPKVSVASTAGAGDALLAGVLSGLSAGLPLLPAGTRRESLSKQSVRTALDLGVLTASYSVTSAHTIHPDASLATLLAFAESHGMAISAEFLAVCQETESNSVGGREGTCS